MIEKLQGVLAQLLPMEIKESNFTDPTLSLIGDGRALNSTSAWRVLKDDGILDFGWSHEDASDLIWDLCGLLIVLGDQVTAAMPHFVDFMGGLAALLEGYSDEELRVIADYSSKAARIQQDAAGRLGT